MREFNFTKMNGAGNDFIVFDSFTDPKIILNGSNIRRLCDRRKGIGADGVLLIEPTENNDFDLKYYNSDGSLGSLCANGSRCSIKYAFDKQISKSNLVKFSCNGQDYCGEVLNEELVKFSLNAPTGLKLGLKIAYNDDFIIGHYVNTGSPHVVILWEDLKRYVAGNYSEFGFAEFGKKIRSANEFKPDGTNVNIIKMTREQCNIRTYERGVEDETLSCGTGTVASAIIINQLKMVSPPITFLTFGNDKMTVDFDKNNDKFHKITLTGPVKINYIGSCNF